jgi:hypothetical protein
MKRIRALPWALRLLDDGLRLYRRNFSSFVLVGSVVLIPMAVAGLLIGTFVRTQLGETWATIGSGLGGLVQYPIVLYACMGLSRTTESALQGRPLKLRDALRLRPLRGLGMGCYGLVLAVVLVTFTMILGVAIVCPILYMMIFGIGILGRVGGSGSLGAIGSVFGVFFSLIVVVTLLITCAMLASLAYAVQAFALEDRRVGSAISRSLDLLLFRIGRNLLVFIGAGAIIGTLLIAYTGTLLAGGASLFQLLDLQLSPIATQALSSAVITASWVLLLPPLPIWMALLHRALAEERDGADLVAEIERWNGSVMRDA